ncbi:hypothetical protein VTN02DRAFT_1493 [Thermoascus thermophilus]
MIYHCRQQIAIRYPKRPAVWLNGALLQRKKLMPLGRGQGRSCIIRESNAGLIDGNDEFYH